MAKYFYIQPFSEAVAQLENTVDSAIAEAQNLPDAMPVLASEIDNVHRVLAKFERAFAKFNMKNASDGGAGVLN